MNEIMTATIPSQYITLGGITYLLTPVENIKNQKLVEEFKDYLDRLDPEVFNEANEIYGNNFNLNEFSNLITVDNLSKDQINLLKKCITIYKDIVKEVTQNKIIKLLSVINSVDDSLSFGTQLELAMQSIEDCIRYAEENHLTDTQEFINWEDDLNTLSVKDHNVK